MSQLVLLTQRLPSGGGDPGATEGGQQGEAQLVSACKNHSHILYREEQLSSLPFLTSCYLMLFGPQKTFCHCGILEYDPYRLQSREK